MKSLNPNLYPRGGFFFKESDGARIFGDTWAGVMTRVAAYRKRAGYPPGDVVAEVTAQACQNNPTICVEENAAYTHEKNRASLKGRVLTWLAKMNAEKTKNPVAFVGEEEARSRATVCASCPRNQSLPEGCASCRAAVVESRKNLVGRRQEDARINSCATLGEELNAAIWLDRPRIEPGDLPGNCWQRRQV